jgi:hypothetical protein
MAMAWGGRRGDQGARCRVVRARFVQPALPASEPPEFDPKIVFELGWDYARLGVAVRECMMASKAFADGYRAGREHWMAVPNHDRFVKKWLALRMSAWQRGRRVSEEVTPDYLRSIEVGYCPITRQPLTHGTMSGTDASIDRINNALDYVRSNLVVMSARANQAKGSETAAAMLYALRELERHGPQARYRALNVEQWSRMATLTAFGESFADPNVALAWPLVAMPAPGMAVRDLGFAAKVTITILASLEPGRAPVRALLPEQPALDAYHAFGCSLRAASELAALALPDAQAFQASRWAVEDAWRCPEVNVRWNALLPHLRRIGLERVQACGGALAEQVLSLAACAGAARGTLE